jgi:RNA polymerase sigma factor (sigma-70 family)
MPHAPLDAVLGHVRRLAGQGISEDTPDQHLLRRFAEERDEAAFAQLVRRHGPMVLGVCRRVLHDSHAADDVFQATFLALARRPGSIRNQASVGSWLHQVAHRLAKRTCYATVRRRAYEHRSPIRAATNPADEMSWREMCELLDAELQALPDQFRAPLVLCYLEGLTRDEAARRLGWTAGAVKGRLERGRDMLRRRLTRRGITVSAALLGTLLTQDTASAVAGPLTAATVRYALSFVTGRTTELPPSVVLQADAVIRALLLARLKVIALALLLTCAAVGAGVWMYGATVQSEEPSARTAAPEPSKAEEPAAVQTDRFGDPLPAGALARMGTASLRHGSSVFFVTFLPNGKQVLSAGEDGLARLWDVATGKEVRCFGTPGAVPPLSLAVALSPDGKTLATCDGDDGVHLWDTATGRVTGRVPALKLDAATEAEFAGRGPVAAEFRKALKTIYGLAFPPDGKTLAAASGDGLVVLWDLGKHAEVGRLDGRPSISDSDLRGTVRSRILRMVRGPNGPAGGGQGIWGEREIPHLAFSTDGKTLLAASMGFRKPIIRSAVKLWDLATGKELRHVEVGDKTFAPSAALSPDGTAVAWADGSGNVHLMEAATGKELHRFSGESPPVVSGDDRSRSRFAFAPDGQTLITQPVGTKALVVWDLKTGKPLRRLGKALWPPDWPAGTSLLTPPGLAVSPDGKTVAAAGNGNAVTLFDLATGREIHPRGGHPAAVTAVRYSPDGRTLISVGGDGSIRTWEADGCRETGLAQVPDGTLTSALSSDGRTLASAGGDGKVHLTETATGKERGILSTPNRGALRLALSPDGKTLAVGDDTRPMVWLYDMVTGKQRSVLRPPGGEKELPPRGGIVVPFRTAPPPVFSPDGRLLAAPIRGALEIWDVVADRHLRRFVLPEDHAIASAVFTPDSRSVALDIEDGAVTLWELATGKQRRLYGTKPSSFTDHPLEGAPPGFALPIPRTDPVLLAISPGGRLLAHSRGREVHVWEVGSAKEVGRLRGHQGAVLAGAFAPDGKTLTTAGADTTALVWDLAALSHATAVSRALTVEARDAAWVALAGDDAGKGFDAVLALAAAPQQAVPLLKERLEPALPAEAQQVARLIADLDSTEFNKRENARKELEALGEQVEPALHKALESRPALESRQRLEALLEKASELWRNPSPERVRMLRSLEVLERAGTEEARQVLEALARGAPGARLTEEAKAAAERLARR